MWQKAQRFYKALNIHILILHVINFFILCTKMGTLFKVIKIRQHDNIFLSFTSLKILYMWHSIYKRKVSCHNPIFMPKNWIMTSVKCKKKQRRVSHIRGKNLQLKNVFLTMYLKSTTKTKSIQPHGNRKISANIFFTVFPLFTVPHFSLFYVLCCHTTCMFLILGFLKLTFGCEKR